MNTVRTTLILGFSAAAVNFACVSEAHGQQPTITGVDPQTTVLRVDLDFGEGIRETLNCGWEVKPGTKTVGSVDAITNTETINPKHRTYKAAWNNSGIPSVMVVKSYTQASDWQDGIFHVALPDGTLFVTACKVNARNGMVTKDCKQPALPVLSRAQVLQADEGMRDACHQMVDFYGPKTEIDPRTESSDRAAVQERRLRDRARLRSLGVDVK